MVKVKEDLGDPLSFDPAFAGPISHRKCRDILFLLIFIAFWGLIWYIYNDAVAQVGTDGYSRIVFPIDTHGRYCGKASAEQTDAIPFVDADNRATGFEDWGTYLDVVDPDVTTGADDLTDYTLLWFPVTLSNISDINLDTCVCVNSCPGADETDAIEVAALTHDYWCSSDFARFMSDLGKTDKFTCPPNSECTNAYDEKFYFLTTANYGSLAADFVLDSDKTAILGLECHQILYRSTPAFYSYRRCMPFPTDLTEVDLVQDIASQISSFIGDSASSAAVAELASSLYIMIGGAVLAVIFAFVWLVLLRLVAKFIVWITLLGVLAVGLFASYFYLTEALAAQTWCDANDCSETKEGQVQNGLYIAYGVCGVTGVYLLMLLCCIKRINLAIDVVLEAARAIAALPWLVVLPVFFVLASLVVVALCGYVGATVYATGELYMGEGGHRSFTFTNMQYAYLGTVLLAALWGAYFMSGVSQVTIAGAVATYYWRKDKRAPLRRTVLKSLFRALFFHLGSIAFGSFLIALVTWIRIVFQFVKKKAQQANPNGAIKYIMGCVDCLLACFERFLKYVNRNAYIQIAVYGDNFCKSARRAVQLIFRNIMRLAALNAIGDSLLFLGKIFVALAASVCTALYIIHADTVIGYLGTVEYWQLPSAIVFVFGYLFGSMFFNVTEMAVDTIMQCFLEDAERNDGTATRPYYAPSSLRRYI